MRRRSFPFEVVFVLILFLAVAAHFTWRCINMARMSPYESVFHDYSPTSIGKAWAIVGSPGSDNLAFVDADGAVQPGRNSYRVEFFLYDRDSGKLYSPMLADVHRLGASSFKGECTLFWSADGLRFSQGTYASADSCYTSIYINSSSRERRVSVFAVALPYQVTGVKHASDNLRYDEKTRSIAVGGKVLLHCAGSCIRGLGETHIDNNGGVLQSAVGSDVTGYIRRGLVPRRSSVDASFSGITSGVIRCDMEIKPEPSIASVLFVMPMKEDLARNFHVPTEAALLDSWPHEDRKWQERCDTSGPFGLLVPDERVESCWRSSLSYLVMLCGDGVPKPGAAKYHAFWVRDAAYMSDALYYAGQKDLIPAGLAEIRKMQLPNGGFLPKTKAAGDDELDAPGEAIYAWVQQYRRTGDMQALKADWPRILAACKYIRGKRIDGNGVLPASVSAEDLGKADQQHYWDDFWCVRGLRDAAFAGRKLGKTADAKWMQAEADSLLKATIASAHQSMLTRDAPDYIPNGPQDLTSSAMARGTSCALWPCDVLDVNDPLTKYSFDLYWSKWIAPSGGGFVHKNHYWPYAGMDLAQGYLMLGQRERAWKILDWTLSHDPTHGFYSWPEGMSRKDLGLAEGDMPHGWMCAAYISLVRNMLVRERDGELVLLSGVPKQWLKPGAHISVSRFPTEFGPVSFDADVVGKTVKVTWRGAKPRVRIRVLS